MNSAICARRSTHTSSSSGSSETEVTELAVIPWVSPPAAALTTVTPVANRPTVLRYVRSSMSMPPSSSSLKASVFSIMRQLGIFVA